MTSFALADDVMRQVDESKQLVLVGLSMGSAIGATITSLWPESVRAALHIAPAWFDEVEFPREPSEDAEAGPSHEPPGTRRAWEPLRAVGPIVGWSEADRQHYRSEFTKAAPDATSRTLIESPRALPIVHHDHLQLVPSAVLTWSDDPFHIPGVAHDLAHSPRACASIQDRPLDCADEAELLRHAFDRLLQRSMPSR